MKRLKIETQEKLLSTREVSRVLKIPESQIIELAKNNIIPHFKVAGEFLRFKKEDMLRIKPVIKKKYNVPEKNGLHLEKVKEFFYFYDFYLVSVAIIILLLWVIIKDIIFEM